MKGEALRSDEVLLFEGEGESSEYKGTLLFSVTSQRLVIEKKTGLLKKTFTVVDDIALDTVKFFNGSPQVKQSGNTVEMQTIKGNIHVTLSGFMEAGKFSSSMVSALTGTTTFERGAKNVRKVIDLVNDATGMDLQDTVQSVVKHGVVGTLLRGGKRR